MTEFAVSNVVQSASANVQPERIAKRAKTSEEISFNFGNIINNLSKMSQGIIMGLPTAMLKDSTLSTWEAATTVPFIGNLTPFFLSGLESREPVDPMK